jgi:citrate synthase
VQSALAMLGPSGASAVIDISDEEARDQLARASVMALSFVAQSARGAGSRPCPQPRSTGHDDPRALPHPLARRGDPDHAKAIDAYWISAASTA